MTKVKIYTTPTCHYCIKTKAFFKEHGVKYEEIDVSEDQKKAAEAFKLSGQPGVPVIVVGDVVIVGFNEKAFRENLNIK